MDCRSKAGWHLEHLRLMLCGVLLGTSVGHVLHSLTGLDLQAGEATASCGFIALAHWVACQKPYQGDNWF